MEVRLRRLRHGDTPRVHELLSDMDVVRHMPFPLFREYDAGTFVHDAITSALTEGAHNQVWAIMVDADHYAEGLGGLVLDPLREDAEVWVLVDKRDWRKGIGAHAVRLLIDAGFQTFGLHRIWAACVAENPGSAGVLERNGMRLEGRCLKSLCIHGEWRDSLLYAILAKEWAARPR
jgi:RimJ/RimL family protein N-acetyltransferase